MHQNVCNFGTLALVFRPHLVYAKTMSDEAIRQRIGQLRARAAHARQLSATVGGDIRAYKNVLSFADDLDQEAERLEAELNAAAVERVSLPDEPQPAPEAIAAMKPDVPPKSAAG